MSAAPLLFSLTASAYGLAAVTSLAHLLGRGERLRGLAVGGLLFAVVVHLVFAGVLWSTAGVGPFSGLGPALSSAALFSLVALLPVARRPRFEVVGAFVTPVAFLLLLTGHFISRGTVAHGTLFALHVGSNMVGLAALTVACGLSVTWLLLDRQVKRKKLTSLYRRLPPLERLDLLSFRMLLVGLPALVVGAITGHLVLVSRGARDQLHYFALICCVLVGAVLGLRHSAGWSGRRAALGTVVGYFSAVVVVAVYLTRGGNP